MKILFATTSTNNTETVLSSLDYLKSHEISVFQYDRKWNMECQQAVTANPSVRDQLQAGQWPPPDQREGWRKRVRTDDDLLTQVDVWKPDVVIYISAWEGLFVLEHETLGAINQKAPVVHMCFDGADNPWWPQMKVFEEKGLFSLTLNIDGSHVWPGGKEWGLTPYSGEAQWRIKNGLTLLTPLDPRFFNSPDNPFMQRPYGIAYAGNHGGWLRDWLFQKMSNKGYATRVRDDVMGSYGFYCRFLQQCKAVVSVPFTGSTTTYHVKGRVLEAGYAGACLMEWRNEATRAWFTPRHMFWEYEGVENCIEECEWLIGHPKLCEEMARNLHHEVTTKHDPHSFWTAVLDRVK
jgi:hypothetical protein